MQKESLLCNLKLLFLTQFLAKMHENFSGKFSHNFHNFEWHTLLFNSWRANHCAKYSNVYMYTLYYICMYPYMYNTYESDSIKSVTTRSFFLSCVLWKVWKKWKINGESQKFISRGLASLMWMLTMGKELIVSSAGAMIFHGLLEEWRQFWTISIIPRFSSTIFL